MMTVPFRIDSPEEADALSIQSVMLDSETNAWQKYDDTEREDVSVVWACQAYNKDFTSQELFAYHGSGLIGFSLQPFVCIYDGKQ